VTSSSRFTVAIHILTLLAFAGPEPCTSEFIAGSVSTNPVVIRRLLARLRAAGLAASQGGPGGGWHLCREPEALTLAEVFRAVEPEELFPLHAAEPNPRCPVGRTIQRALEATFREARTALERDLERTTIASLLARVSALR
jgi:Rrf2 family protein